MLQVRKQYSVIGNYLRIFLLVLGGSTKLCPPGHGCPVRLAAFQTSFRLPFLLGKRAALSSDSLMTVAAWHVLAMIATSILYISTR